MISRIPVPHRVLTSTLPPTLPQGCGTPEQGLECTEVSHEGGGRRLSFSWAEVTPVHGDTCWTSAMAWRPELAKEGRGQGPSLTGSKVMPRGLGNKPQGRSQGPAGTGWAAVCGREAPLSWGCRGAGRCFLHVLVAPLSSHMFWVGAQFKLAGSLPRTFLFPGVILTRLGPLLDTYRC